MLPIAVTLFLLAAIITGFHVFGTMAAGAIAFAAGFAILAGIAGLSFWTHRTA